MSDEGQNISIHGARVHNLKNVTLKIPRNKLIVFTGKSGSGKSSLAFDTIHAEGQRRYLETFNAYARQFLGNMKRPDVDKITGLSPVVAIEQKTTSKNPRSTVGTITEIYDYLRLLYSRIGTAYSYNTGKKMVSFTDNQIVELLKKDLYNKQISILSPIIRARKGNYKELFRQLKRKGYLKVRIDGEITNLEDSLKLDRYKYHDIEVLIDILTVSESNEKRLYSSLNVAMNDGDGVVLIVEKDSQNTRYFSRQLMCVDTGIATIINFPINIVLLYIAANTFIRWMDSQESEIFWTSVYLTVCFGIIAIIRKTIIRHYFDKKNRKNKGRNA